MLPLVLHYGVWTFKMVYDMAPNLMNVLSLKEAKPNFSNKLYGL